MDATMQGIWFWQRIVSPHMAGLASQLAELGCQVTYAAEALMSEDRAKQGWSPPELGKARLKIVTSINEVDTLMKEAPVSTIHICQGIRANGMVSEAQRLLAAHGLRHWIVMETVNDSGWHGMLKRLEYRRLFAKWRGCIDGMLAIGYRTPQWIVSRGVPATRVFPFTYFMADDITDALPEKIERKRFRFIYVGRFIKLKQLDLLINALSRLQDADIELAVVGTGPMENELRMMAEAALPGRVDWIGKLPASEVSQYIAQSDCLVLPSSHDGWGAVITEALMAGIPVICSDACGAADVVKQSGYGSVFRSGQMQELVDCLVSIKEHGPIDSAMRMSLARWAKNLGAIRGATYLLEIINHFYFNGVRPSPPWIHGPDLADGILTDKVNSGTGR